jgi:hypothetical protein
MVADYSRIPDGRNENDVYIIPDSEEDSGTETSGFEDVTHHTTYSHRRHPISTSQKIDQTRSRILPWPITSLKDQAPDNASAYDNDDDDPTYNLDNEKGFSELNDNEGIDKSMKPDLFDDILRNPHRKKRKIHSQLTMQTERSRIRSTQQNRSMNVGGGPSRAKISMERSVSSAHNGRVSESADSIRTHWTRANKERTSGNQQTQKRKAVSPLSYDQITDQSNNEFYQDLVSNADSENAIELPNPNRQQKRREISFRKRRILWTEEETRRLIKLFEYYGPRWRLIKQKDNRHPRGAKLTERTEIDLKDKIRNVKAGYLR